MRVFGRSNVATGKGVKQQRAKRPRVELVMGDRIFNIVFYLVAPFGVAAAVYNDSPWLACFLAFTLGHLFQIDIRSIKTIAEE